MGEEICIHRRNRVSVLPHAQVHAEGGQGQARLAVSLTAFPALRSADGHLLWFASSVAARL
jgi:hypothetical protein